MKAGIWYWQIVQLTVGLSVVAFLAIFAMGGWTEDTVRQAIRLSAEVAAVLFCMAFSASAVQGLYRGSFTFWWRQNRRWFGISFAIVHLMHLGFLVLLQGCFHPVFTLAKTGSLAVGGMAYVFVVAMLATSFPVFAKRLKPAHWKLLHTVGGWWIWVVFANSYLKRALTMPEYLPWAALLVATALLRLFFLIKKARRRGCSASDAQ